MIRAHRLLPTLLALLLLLSAMGCSSGAGKSQSGTGPDSGQGTDAKGAGEKDQGQSQTPAIELSQSFTDPETGLVISFPDEWIATPFEDAMVALISPQNGEDDFYLENVLITSDDQFQELTMERYLEALSAEVRNRYADTETVESGTIEIDGLTGHWMVDTFTGPKGPSQVYRVVLLQEPVAYVLHGTAPLQTFARYRAIFEAVAESIHWRRP